MSEVIKSSCVVNGKSYTYNGNRTPSPIPFKEKEKQERSQPPHVQEKGEEDVIERAKEAARKTLDDANACAVRVIQKASEEAKATVEIARREGYRDGLERGKQEAENACQESLNELSALIRKVEEKKAEMLLAYEPELRELAFNIAGKIIGSELEKNDQAFLSLYRNAVKEMKGCEWLKVMVSECEVSFATANAELLLSMVKDAKEIKIVPLENAPRGTLVVETPECIVDGGVTTQMERLHEAFRAAEVPAGTGKKE